MYYWVYMCIHWYRSLRFSRAPNAENEWQVLALLVGTGEGGKVVDVVVGGGGKLHCAMSKHYIDYYYYYLFIYIIILYNVGRLLG